MAGGRRRFVGFLIPFILLWTFYTVSKPSNPWTSLLRMDEESPSGSRISSSVIHRDHGIHAHFQRAQVFHAASTRDK
jgi:hypothetical protein